jgi:glycerol dehydrogenase-like iron-containing ADH family enzyme
VSGSSTIGVPFHCVEADAVEVLAGRGTPLVVCANEPPWSSVRARLAGVALAAEIDAWDMDVAHLDSVVEGLAASTGPDELASATVVGLGGGTALDTAKYVAWRTGRPLVQVPTITSVDAGFTDAIGIRDLGKVRYVGTVVPELVVLDLPLIRSAPPRLNRAGVGDVLSCHTGLFDWRLATEHGTTHPWHTGLAALGAVLLDQLESAADEIAAVSDDGVRFLADAYRRIGAACAWAGHSRFEEGSEHFWAYAYEHATGAHPVHGEIISFAVCALAEVQGNEPERARRIVERSHVRAHPADLGITQEAFASCLLGLAAYARREGLDQGVADFVELTTSHVDRAWAFVTSLPRRD